MNLKGHCHRREALLFQRKPPKLEDACGIFPNHIEEIEQRELKVLTSTCDGASLHCKFYCFHCSPGAPKGTLIFKTKNVYDRETRPINFICDPMHLKPLVTTGKTASRGTKQESLETTTCG